MAGLIESVAALEAIIGRTPPAVNLKVIDHIDAGARRWLAASPLMFAGFDAEEGMAITLGGGVRGFAGAEENRLAVPLDSLDDPRIARPGAGFSSLFLVPGIGETLRINGRVADCAGGVLSVAVEECYAHCAKALIRSEFWKAEPTAARAADAEALVAATRFVALATADAAGNADLSPKGDPAGAMVRMDRGRLCFADRPGNRRADGFRNILTQPRIAAVLLVPGSSEVALVQGTASLTTDEAMLAGFAVQGKVPLLATCIDAPRIELRVSPALERAQLWPAAEAPADIRPAKMFADHVRLNKARGLGARVAAAFVSVPGLMQKGLDKDYKDNLY